MSEGPDRSRRLDAEILRDLLDALQHGAGKTRLVQETLLHRQALDRHLKRLQAAGVVVRDSATHRYHLTERGEAFRGALHESLRFLGRQ